MAETKIVSRIKKSSFLEGKISEERRKEEYLVRAKEGLESFEELYAEVEKLWGTSETIFFENKELIFYPKLMLLMGSGKESKKNIYSLESNMNWEEQLLKWKDKVKKIDNWEMSPLTENEARSIYFKYKSKNRNKNYNQLLCLSDVNNKDVGIMVSKGEFLYLKDVLGVRKGNYYSDREFIRKIQDLTSDISTVRAPIGYRFDKKLFAKIQILMLIGTPLDMESKGLYQNLLELLEKKIVEFKDGRAVLTLQGIEVVKGGKCSQIGKAKIVKKVEEFKETKNKKIKIDLSKISADEKANILSYYSDCDQMRANITPYDISWLEDPNRGHWELWEGNEDSDLIEIASGNKIYARNPKSDVKSDCLVGIDFGTKSTVVVRQDETGSIQLMPIGNGDIRKELEKRDFENPTVMQFVNFPEFIKRYTEREGRPYTRWQDLLISHAANEGMKDSDVRSTEFYSYLYDLKQWAGEGKKILNLRDKKGNDFLLTPYTKIGNRDEAEMDPIELYAYYIGLYINNMNNGIYLDYLLSFPVTYEKGIRDAILNSFERGLKKSLPQSLLQDEEVMEHFQVMAGSSEPAAYAICALEEYGFEPEEGEKVFYGIFDFGGGTSDFDFGLWTKSEEEDLFDYCIEHFGTQGDRYLGGENLLQLLAFEVFSENMKLCREKKIPFAKPLELSSVSPELSGFVNDSQEARMNQKLMMEKLRPFWERSEGRDEEEIDITQFSEFQIGLFNVDGVLQSNLAFGTDIERLNEILKNRIEKGVKQFFEALKDTFSSKHIGKTASADKINFFLAGNSSKSKILQEIFRAKIEEWNENINARLEKADEIGRFILFPALGTNEAEQIQEERGIAKRTLLSSPTGKTGVAWGLIEGREGGRIEVKEEISFESEAKFLYYLGIQRGKVFFPKIRRDEEYMKWVRFLPAKRRVNEILYTSLPEAVNGNLSYSETGVFRKRIELPFVGEDYYIYIRFVTANSIEFAVGDDDGNIDMDTIKKESF